jgi:hypothetical protein
MVDKLKLVGRFAVAEGKEGAGDTICGVANDGVFDGEISDDAAYA